MFSVRPLWKKGRRRRFFFFFFFQNGRRTHFPKQPAGLFFQDGCQFFVLMGPTWTRDMTSVYLRLDLEKDRIFRCFFNSKKNIFKKEAASKKEAGGDAKHVFFLLRLRVLIRAVLVCWLFRKPVNLHSNLQTCISYQYMPFCLN